MHFRLHGSRISVRNRQRCEINVAVLGFLAGNIIHPGGDILAVKIKWNTLLIEYQRAAGQLPQLGNHALPDSLPEGTTVQINQETGHDDGQRQTGKNYESPESAFLGGSGR